METSSRLGVLVVDDFERWRNFSAMAIARKPELQILGEASDGLLAVQKAQELQPDLILLDIGLPALNGIEAARRIREVSPKSTILFMSENRSPDIAAEALSVGAGYVIKSDAATELAPALDAVLQGGRYISSSLAGSDLNSFNSHAGDQDGFEKVPPPARAENDSSHEVKIYPDDAALIDDFAAFVTNSLHSGHVVVVITTESHRADIVERLRADVVDTSAVPLSFMVIASDDIAAIGGGVDYSLIESVNEATKKNLHVAVG
jgi:DNA-binding NarL/FixJ family response regulator